MAYLNIKSKQDRTYDAIVIGSGASGGWAAKELCEAGLKTLVLDRGRDVKHVLDYPTASKAPYDFEFRGSVPVEKRAGLMGGWRFRAETNHWAIQEDEQEVVYEKPFRWFRGYHVGGKSLLWARQTQRWSDFDFEGPQRDGFATDWPIRYKDLKPYYDKVESFIGIAGSKDGLPELPDSIVQPPFEMNCLELHFKEILKKHYPERSLIHGRCAHLTDPQEIHFEQGRVKCQHQNMCNRGCNFGGYFSSNSSTLPWAMKTGNLTIRPDAVVHSIIYDESKGKAKGVKLIDRLSGEEMEYYSRIIFVNASTINSNAILMNSRSNRFPEGLGNDHGILGKYMIWHNYRGKGYARHEGFKDVRTDGKNPSHSYIPRFRNVFKQEMEFLRGYSIGIGGGRGLGADKSGIGDTLRESILNPEYGEWGLASWMQGAVIPRESNHIRLHETLKDKYGIPQIVFSMEYSENEELMTKDYMQQQYDMFEKAGFKDIEVQDTGAPPGSDIHEMGGIRMGKDPKNSMLNEKNQLHLCKNVFVSDGACMTSSSTQNPTLTFMALTARSADMAIQELNKGNI